MKDLEHNNIDILELIGWDIEKMAQYRYNQAEEWLEKKMKFDHGATTQIMLESQFWDWWAVQWRKRDREFMKTFGRITGPDDYQQEVMAMQYEKYHAPFSIDAYPNFRLLEKAYDDLVDSIIQNHHQTRIRKLA